MPNVTILAGLLLTALGLVGYFGAATETPSPTSLIPAFFGAPLILCGLVGMKEGLRKHAMHAAAAIGLIGALAAGGRGLSKIGTLFSDEAGVNRRPVLFVLLMALICVIYVGFSVRSFIAARKRREAAEAQASA